MKPVVFCGDSLKAIRAFPDDAKRSVGHELRDVQHGLDPSDWKPMPSIGAGVREIRIRESSGAFRVIYVASLPNAVFVLHAFQKKSRATPTADLRLAAARLGAVLKEL